MKITETIERECCAPGDLKQYQGLMKCPGHRPKFRFCTYCGQLWMLVREMGPAGSMEDNWERCDPIPSNEAQGLLNSMKGRTDA